MTHARSTLSLAGSISMLALLASPSAAKTDLEKFQAKVGKVAVQAAGFPEQPKGLCMCTDTILTGFVGKAGAIRMQVIGSPQRVDLLCAVPTFDGSGNRTGFVGCSIFLPLTR